MTLAGASAASTCAVASTANSATSNPFAFIRPPRSSSYQYSFDAAVVCSTHVLRQPLRAEHVPRDLHDDVVGVQVRIVVVALQPLHARRARREHLHLAFEAVGAQACRARLHLSFLAEAHLC